MGNSCNQNQKKQGGANQEKDNNKTFPASGSPRAKRAAKPQRSNRQRGAGYGIQSVFSLLKSFGVGKAARIFPRKTRLFTARFTMCSTAAGRVVKKTR